MAEYLGGILAASSSGVIRDDRGVTLLTLLRGMSAYSVRAHFLCYREYCRLHNGRLTQRQVFEGSDLPNTNIAEDTRVFAQRDGFIEGMGLAESEDYYDVYYHVRRALERHNLLEFGPQGNGPFISGVLQRGTSVEYSINEDGFVYDTASAGDELFLWAIGFEGPRYWVDSLLVAGVHELHASVPDVASPPGFNRLSDLMIGVP